MAERLHHAHPARDPPILSPPLHASFRPEARSNATPSPAPSARLHVARDPILRNLSPTKTLRALRASSPTHHTGTELDLMKTCNAASSRDRDFGVRVAQTCKDLREWATEVEAWEWPGTFEPPVRSERRAKRRRMLMEHNVSPSYFDNEAHDTREADVFWGSLPKELVEAYEIRIDEIHQAMEVLDVEGLKSHVRSVHILPKSAQTKTQDEYVSFRVGAVDDFTTLITATILQALPYMSWLTRLLNEWSIRLQILRKVPGFLAGLEDTNRHLQSAWTDMEEELNISTEAATSIRDSLHSTQKVLGSKVSALGQRLDSMLDELQDRAETLPDSWIDAFENLEATYSSYVVKSEQRITGLLWEFDLPSAQETPTPGVEGLGIFTVPMKTVSADSPQIFQPQPTRVLSTVASRERIESPLLGQHAWIREDSVVSNNVPATRARQDSAYTRFMDDVIAESLDQPPMPEPSIVEQTYLYNPAAPELEPVEARPATAPSQSSSPGKSGKSPRLRPRHVPINIAPYEHEAFASATMPSSANGDTPHLNGRQSRSRSPQKERPRTSGSVSSAKRRSFFGGRSEHKQSLHRSGSPARPLDQAASAFTKYFKPTSENDMARTKSSASRKTLKKKSSKHRNHASISSTKTSPDTPAIGAVTPRAEKRNSAATVHSISAALKRVSAQETAPERPFEPQPAAVQQPNDWSDKEVILAYSPSDKITSPRALYDSPFDHLRSSGQWPLTSPTISRAPESHDGIIRSDAFEQLFVDTLPQSPQLDEDAYALNLLAFENYINQLREIAGISPNNIQPYGDSAAAAMENAADQLSDAFRKAGRHKRQESDNLSIPAGYDSSSAIASNISTAAIEDASSAGFHRPQMVHNVRSSRNSSIYKGATGLYAPAGATNQSTAYAGESGDSAPVSGDQTPTQASLAPPQNMRGRASDASLSSCYDAPSNLSTTIRRERSDTTRSEPSFPMPPNYKPANHNRNQSEKDGRSMLRALRTDNERSVIGTRLGAVKPRPLAIVTPSISEDSSSAESPAPRGETSWDKTQAAPVLPAKSSRRRTSNAPNPMGDNIDQHVTKVLLNIPSNIRFEPKAAVSGSGPVTSKATPLMSNPPALRRASLGLTLSAVNPSEPSLKRHVKDGETKLYHLSQPGREQPIKLFVRLVGENERVMVRVGGGWMDLEEYLRQYAAHHPQRTASSQTIELVEAAKVDPVETRSPVSAFDRRRSGMVFNNLPVLDTAVSPLDPTATYSFDNAPVSAVTATSTATLPFFGIGRAPTPPTLPTSYLDPPSPSGTPPLLGERLDPLRSNPTSPRIASPRIVSDAATLGVGARNSSFNPPAPSLWATQFQTNDGVTEEDESAEGSVNGSRRESYLSESDVTAIHAGAASAVSSSAQQQQSPRPAKATTGAGEGLDAQKAQWVEEMVERAKQSASAGKIRGRAARTSQQSSDLSRAGATQRMSMREAVGGEQR